MDLRTLKWYLNAIMSPLGIILNILLFYFIKYKSSQKLQNYKKVLYLGCFTDIGYGIVMAAAQPSVSMIDGIYFVFIQGIPGSFPFPWNTWAFIPNVFMMYFTITNASIQFLYRYLLLCWDYKLNIYGFLGLVFIAFIACGGFSYVWINSILNRGAKDDLFYAPLLNGTEFMMDGKLSPFGAFPFREKIFGFGWLSILIISTSYALVWFCAISIFIKLKKMKPLHTKKSMKHQGQINIVLIVEALTPFITIVIPLILDMVIIILNVRVYWAGEAPTLISAFSPPINCIVKLMVVTCYRKALIEAIFPKNKFTSFFISKVSG